MGEQPLGGTTATAETTGFETIKVEGSDSKIYVKLMKHHPVCDAKGDGSSCQKGRFFLAIFNKEKLSRRTVPFVYLNNFLNNSLPSFLPNEFIAEFVAF